MSPTRALQIIYNVWGSNGVINALEAQEVDAAALPGERAIETLSRIAGIKLDDIMPFDPDAWKVVRKRVACREIQLLREA